MPTADQYETPEAGPAKPGSPRRGSGSVRRQLLIGLGLVAVMVAAPTIYALARLDRIGAIARDLRGQYAQSSVVLGEAQAALADLDRHLRGYVATGEPALRGRAVQSWNQADAALGELAESGYEGARAVRTRLVELSAAVDVVLWHMDRGELQEASLAFETVKPLLAESRREIWPLARAIDERAARTVSRAEETSVATATTLLLALLGTLLLAGVIAIWTTRKVSGPLHDLKEAVTGLAHGRFRAPPDLPYDRSDEIGA
ncbi:MAG: hypothetical protein GWM90_03660, partial [Gemmatimonadetes bacterium]|nr:hypothetical protein [Gemmatimonadota bacterium]NIQ57840.1 hypothetical protein [Gemmatimonadota bacterium]NIU77993.1 hypothetical protein [Gammaproteobacteria bacterium]NIX43247.1 hypothetical protein [Gemmatimonadota bacterium]NIY07419.1 hypothetical protein [Gemmatimonadota bacterium]